MEVKDPAAPLPAPPAKGNGASAGKSLRSMSGPIGAPGRYAMSDLERETGFNARTIRYYITQGLLPPAHGRGPSATYDGTHLLRLKAIGVLKERHLPLEEIKAELGNLRDEEIARQLGRPTAPNEERWRRIRIHTDIELHVRERSDPGADAAFVRAVDLITKQARLLVEDLDVRHDAR